MNSSIVKRILKLLTQVRGFAHDSWSVATDPNQHFQRLHKSVGANTSRSVIFITLNLLTSLALMHIPVFFSKGIETASLDISAELYRYLIGTMLFVWLLSLYGAKMPLRHIFCVVAQASVVYIPFTLITIGMLFVFGDALRKFWVLGMSGAANSLSDLLIPFREVSKMAFLLIGLLIGVFYWWGRVLAVGFGVLDRKTTRAKTRVRILLAAVNYLVCLAAVFFFFSTIFVFSAFSNDRDYKALKEMMRKESVNYPEVLLLSQKLAGAKYITEHLKYTAQIISALAKLKTFAVPSTTLSDVRKLIGKGRIREAHVQLGQFIKNEMPPRDDQRRMMFKIVESELGDAEKIYNSKTYSDADKQFLFFSISLADIPFSVFP